MHHRAAFSTLIWLVIDKKKLLTSDELTYSVYFGLLQIAYVFHAIGYFMFNEILFISFPVSYIKYYQLCKGEFKIT